MCVNLIFFNFSFLLCYIPTHRNHGAIGTIDGVILNIFLLFFFSEIKVADTKSWNYKE